MKQNFIALVLRWFLKILGILLIFIGLQFVGLLYFSYNDENTKAFYYLLFATIAPISLGIALFFVAEFVSKRIRKAKTEK